MIGEQLKGFTMNNRSLETRIPAGFGPRGLAGGIAKDAGAVDGAR